jgi:hypothetical protein
VSEQDYPINTLKLSGDPTPARLKELEEEAKTPRWRRELNEFGWMIVSLFSVSAALVIAGSALTLGVAGVAYLIGWLLWE